MMFAQKLLLNPSNMILNQNFFSTFTFSLRTYSHFCENAQVFSIKLQFFERIIMEKWISISDAAQKWGITEQTARRYCRNGLVPRAFMENHIWFVPSRAKNPVKDGCYRLPSPPLLQKILDQKSSYDRELYSFLQVNMAYSSSRLSSNRLTRNHVEYLFKKNTLNKNFFDPDNICNPIQQTLNNQILEMYATLLSIMDELKHEERYKVLRLVRFVPRRQGNQTVYTNDISDCDYLNKYDFLPEVKAAKLLPTFDKSVFVSARQGTAFRYPEAVNYLFAANCFATVPAQSALDIPRDESLDSILNAVECPEAPFAKVFPVLREYADQYVTDDYFRENHSLFDYG